MMNVNYERPSSAQDHPGPYEVTCECNFPVDPNTSCRITLVAIIDTGSPISLLKHELLSYNSDVIKPVGNDCKFSGINGTKLETIGIFETEISVNGNAFNLCFYILPGNTMVLNAILGRDFVTKPNVNLCFQNGVVKFNLNDDINQVKVNRIDDLNQILCLSYENESESVKEKLNINPKVEFNFRNELLELYKTEYESGERGLQNSIDPSLEMKLVLKHDQPISYRARRISYNDREKLKIIIDDLFKEGVIRPSKVHTVAQLYLSEKKHVILGCV